MWARNMFESCVEIRRHFSDYLDNQCVPGARISIRYHLAYCPACQLEMRAWQSMQGELRALPQRRVSPEVALRLRVRMSREIHRNLLGRLWVRFENAFKPLLIPATGGVLAAVISFGLMLGMPVAPPTGDIPDVTLQLVTPPRVRELAPLDYTAGDNGWVVLTQINAAGRAKGYRVLSGERSPEMMQRLDRMIYFSIFQPATMFGKPTDGEMVLSLRHITVRG